MGGGAVLLLLLLLLSNIGKLWNEVAEALREAVADVIDCECSRYKLGFSISMAGLCL